MTVLEVANHTFHLWQKRTFQKTVLISGIASALGYSVRMHFKAKVTDLTPLLTATIGTLSIDTNQLVIPISIPASSIELSTERGVWDFEVTKPDGTLKTYVSGPFIYHGSVTR